MTGNKGDRVMMFIGALIVLGLGFSFAGGSASLFSCGTWVMNLSPLAGLQVIFGGDTSAFTNTATGCTPPTPLIWVVFVAFATLILGAAIVGWLIRFNYRQSDTYLIKDVLRRDGIAQAREVAEKAGPKMVLAKATTIRPSLKGQPKISVNDVGMKLGTSQGCDVYTTAEDSKILIGPPRSGKGFFIIINAILDAPGAVITTSTRGDNYAATWKQRSAIGPLSLFDPQGLTKKKGGLKWAPMQGCTHPMVATRRAKVLIAGSGMGQSSSNQEWAQVSEQILTYLLHAAAIGNRSTTDLSRWGSSASMAKEAVNILQSEPNAVPGWGSALEDQLETDPRMIGSKWMGVSGALQALLIPEIAESMSPATEAESLDPATFIRQKGTLYLIGTKSGGGAAAPFLVALMDEIVETAREMAFRLPGNRLDPPMDLILDEIANLAAWPALPNIMADGGGIGISTLVVLQSLAQARGGWGQEEAQAIFDSAIIKVQLGGAGNDKDLETFVRLLGHRKVVDTNKSWSDSGTSYAESKSEKEVLTIAEMRRIPTGWGLFVGRNGRPIFMEMSKWIDRPDAAQIRAGIKEFNAELAAELEAELNSAELAKV